MPLAWRDEKHQRNDCCAECVFYEFNSTVLDVFSTKQRCSEAAFKFVLLLLHEKTVIISLSTISEKSKNSRNVLLASIGVITFAAAIHSIQSGAIVTVKLQLGDQGWQKLMVVNFSSIPRGKPNITLKLTEIFKNHGTSRNKYPLLSTKIQITAFLSFFITTFRYVHLHFCDIRKNFERGYKFILTTSQNPRIPLGKNMNKNAEIKS